MKFFKVTILFLVIVYYHALTTHTTTHTKTASTSKANLKSKVNLKLKLNSKLNSKMNSNSKSQKESLSMMDFLSNALEKNEIDEAAGNKKNKAEFREQEEMENKSLTQELKNLAEKRKKKHVMREEKAEEEGKKEENMPKVSFKLPHKGNQKVNVNLNQMVNGKNNTNLTVKILEKEENPNVFLKDIKSLDLFKESWLKVSYKRLSSRSTFPTLNLPNMSQSWIHYNNFYTRKNRAYDPKKVKNPNYPPTKYDSYVRLSGKNFFYADTKDSLLVLGSLPLDGLIRSKRNNENNEHCFLVYDNRGFHWKLCAKTSKLRNEWVCILKKILHEKDLEECVAVEETESPITYYEKKIKLPIILIPTAAPYCNHMWNYNAHGQDWECDCKEGKSY